MSGPKASATVKKTTGKRVGDGTPGPGRPPGVQNKNTTLLKDAIIKAAADAGGKDGLVGYLLKQAKENPQSFLTLLGKVLPLQVAGSGEDGEIVTRIILEGVAAK